MQFPPLHYDGTTRGQNAGTVGSSGGNVTLSSLQDIDDYESKQQSISGGLSFTFGSMTGSLSLNVSQSKVNSEYASVGDQSGLFAGDGGYAIDVGNHTQLNGAVIASTASAANNTLSTATLGWDNINNHAEYTASSFSAGGSVGYSKATGFSGAALPSASNMHESASGTTRSAVSAGEITVRDAAAQTQNLAPLSRDTDNANGSIDKIFDKEKVANQMAFAQGVAELGAQFASDLSRNQMEAALNEVAANNPAYRNAKNENERQAALTADPTYQQAMQTWGTGGTFSMAAQAVTAAFSGMSLGNLGAAASGAMAPYLANAIKQATTTVDPLTGQQTVNTTANLIAHAVAGGVLAQMSGGSATGGAVGAAGSEVVAHAIIAVVYPGRNPETLNDQEKGFVSALSQMAGGLAAGIVTNSTAGGTAGQVAGKNAVENNSLSGDNARETVKQAAESLKNQIRDKLGNGTTSAIANGIINALADSGDAALGSADYAADAAMALAACAVGDSYCSKALSDLSDKNQAVADTIIGLMKSETWSAVADTVKQAGTGNQGALEATGGMIASIFLPGKKVQGGQIIAAGNITKVVIDLKKFDYLFGNVKSSEHNADRSTQLAQTMYRLGLETNESGVSILTEHLKQVVDAEGNVIDTYTRGNQNFEVRESLLLGPSGKAAKLETAFEIMPDGSRRFVTTIPKDGKK